MSSRLKDILNTKLVKIAIKLVGPFAQWSYDIQHSFRHQFTKTKKNKKKKNEKLKNKKKTCRFVNEHSTAIFKTFN